MTSFPKPAALRGTLADRLFLLGPILVFSWACGEKADGAGEASGGASGVSGTGGAGATATGGSGAANTGGSSGSSAGGSAGTTACSITVTPSLSTAIATVGIVEWTSDLAGISEAHVDFGLDTSYGMTAPVELTDPNHRTLLLGMKASRTYHFRVVATSPAGPCTSQDGTIATGPVPNGLISVNVTTNDASAAAGGFLVTGMYARTGGSGGGMPSAAAYVLDADGDLVWWHTTNYDVTSARMSYDGKHMWINSSNVPNGTARVHRVSMDGLSDEDLSSQFIGMNHQLTVLPDETIAFYAYGGNMCDDIKERAPDGTLKTIINARDAHGVSGACHVNAIEYSPEDDTLVFSDLDHDNYTKVRRTGEVVWVLGGDSSDFTGMGSEWSRQHGVDVLGLDRFLIFNNGSEGGGTANSPSVAIEILLDLGAMTATRAWSYSAMPPIENDIMGDVQRLENGNTIVAYSTQGVLHEVSPSGTLVQEIEWTSTPGAFGYIQKRKSLYGAPPR